MQVKRQSINTDLKFTGKAGLSSKLHEENRMVNLVKDYLKKTVEADGTQTKR